MHTNKHNGWKHAPIDNKSDTATSSTDGSGDISEIPEFPWNGCRICPIISYVDNPFTAATIKLGLIGAKNCNFWAKKRKMNLKFKVE